MSSSKPQVFPPHRNAAPAATRAGTAEHIRFSGFPQSGIKQILKSVDHLEISSSPRTTCSTRRRCRPACSAGIPTVESIPGRMSKRIHHLRMFRQQWEQYWQMTHSRFPAIRSGSLPASRLLSRPFGYNTTRWAGESLGVGGDWGQGGKLGRGFARLMW